jgi:hypothetical protein
MQILLRRQPRWILSPAILIVLAILSFTDNWHYFNLL